MRESFSSSTTPLRIDRAPSVVASRVAMEVAWTGVERLVGMLTTQAAISQSAIDSAHLVGLSASMFSSFNPDSDSGRSFSDGLSFRKTAKESVAILLSGIGGGGGVGGRGG